MLIAVYIKNRELRSLLLLSIAAICVLGFVENRSIDPWGVFNPRKFGVIVLVLAGLELAGYGLTRLFGHGKSSVIIGFFGGFVSSTAVLLSTLRRSKEEGSLYVPFSVIASAQLASFIEVLIIAALSSSRLAAILAPAFFGGIGVVLAALYFAISRGNSQKTEVAVASPRDWKGVLRLALIFALLLASVAIAERLLGDYGATAVSVIGGTFELHGTILANALLFEGSRHSQELALRNILLAASGSMLAKTAICWTLNRSRLAAYLSALFLVLLIVIWVLSAVFFKGSLWGTH
jgi:uncharacterized membrane protein (DUF4010 family)